MRYSKKKIVVSIKMLTMLIYRVEMKVHRAYRLEYQILSWKEKSVV